MVIGVYTRRLMHYVVGREGSDNYIVEFPPFFIIIISDLDYSFTSEKSKLISVLLYNLHILFIFNDTAGFL